MKLEPDAEAYLRAVRSSSQPTSQMGVDWSRRSSREAEAQFAWDPGVKADVHGETLAVEGGSIPVRVYAPPGAAAGSRLPLLVFIHGGGWVLGWLDSVDLDAVCTYLCVRVNCMVVSVGYRLSPESKFPGPVEDCYAALKWAVENAAALHADAGRVAVAGESAGGNLTAAVTLVARDRGGPTINFQMPIVPVTDFSFGT